MPYVCCVISYIVTMIKINVKLVLIIQTATLRFVAEVKRGHNPPRIPAKAEVEVSWDGPWRGSYKFCFQHQTQSSTFFLYSSLHITKIMLASSLWLNCMLNFQTPAAFTSGCLKPLAYRQITTETSDLRQHNTASLYLARDLIRSFEQLRFARV